MALAASAARAARASGEPFPGDEPRRSTSLNPSAFCDAARTSVSNVSAIRHPQFPNQLGIGLGRSAAQVRIFDQARSHLSIDGGRLLIEHERVVADDARRSHGTGRIIEHVADFGLAGRQPLTFDAGRQPDQRFGGQLGMVAANGRRRAGGRRDVDGDNQLGVVHTAFTRQSRAGARGQHEPIAIATRGVWPHDRDTRRTRRDGNPFRQSSRRRVRTPPRDVPKLVSHPKHVRRQTLVAIDRREQVAGRRAVTRRCGVPIGKEGARARGFGRAVRREEQPAQTRMKRQPLQFVAERRQRPAGVDRLEPPEQIERGLHGSLGRRLRTIRASAGSPPHAITSSTVDVRSTRAISGSGRAGGDRAGPTAGQRGPPASGRRVRRAGRRSPAGFARSRGCRSPGRRRSGTPCGTRCPRPPATSGTVSVVSAMFVARITRRS